MTVTEHPKVASPGEDVLDAAAAAVIEPRVQLSALLAGKGEQPSALLPAIDNEKLDEQCEELPFDYDVGPVLPPIVTAPFALLREQANAAWELFEPAEDDASEEGVKAKQSTHRTLAKAVAVAVVVIVCACIRSGEETATSETLNALFPPLPGFEGCNVATEWCRAARSEFLLRQTAEAERARSEADPKRTARLLNALMQTWHDLDAAIEGGKASSAVEPATEMSLREAATNIASIISQMRARLQAAANASDDVIAEEEQAIDAEEESELSSVINDDIHLLPIFKFAVKHVIRAGATIAQTVQEALAEVTGDMD